MARKKSAAEFLRGMLDAGWSRKQIEQRTGISTKYQGEVLHGRRSGDKYAPALREARQKGGGRAPSARKPISPVSQAQGAGRVHRLPGNRSVVQATKRTDPRLVRQELKRAGHNRVTFSVNGKNVRKYGGEIQPEAEFTLFRNGGIDASEFMHLVDNPGPDQSWTPGDMYGAIMELSQKQGVDSIGDIESLRFDY